MDITALSWAVTAELCLGPQGHGSSSPSVQALKPPWSSEAECQGKAGQFPYTVWGRASEVYTDHDPYPPVVVTFPKNSWPWGHLIHWPQERRMTYLINKSRQVPKFKPSTMASSLNLFKKKKCYLLESPPRPHQRKIKNH